MTHIHAHRRATREQKAQYIAQIQLVIDRRNQQHQQRSPQHKTRNGRQNIHIALGECDGITRGNALHKPVVNAGANTRDTIHKLFSKQQQLVLPTMIDNDSSFVNSIHRMWILVLPRGSGILSKHAFYH